MGFCPSVRSQRKTPGIWFTENWFWTEIKRGLAVSEWVLMVCNIVTPGEKNLIWKCSTSCGEMVGNITKLWLHSRISCLYQSHKTAVTKYATLLFLISYGEKISHWISVLFFTMKKKVSSRKKTSFHFFSLSKWFIPWGRPGYELLRHF